MRDERGGRRFSAFGGRDLDGIVQPEEMDRLNRMGLFDAEQVMAVLAVDAARAPLRSALGFDEGGAADLERRLAAALPAQAMQRLALRPPLLKATGADLMPPERRRVPDALPLAVTAEAPAPLPPSANLASSMPPIRSQGTRGTCVAHALTALNEHHRRVEGDPTDLSEQFLYFRCKLADGDDGCGTMLSRGGQILTEVGQPAEQWWPYDPNPPCNNHGTLPHMASVDAFAHSLPTIALDAQDVDGLRRALAGRSCVAVSIPVYLSWYQSSYVDLTGRINMRIGDEPSDGGHAVCLLGYQDEPASPGGGFFILRNSWGTSWGSQCPYGAGNGTIPYAYLQQDGSEAITAPTPVPPTPSPPIHGGSTGGSGGSPVPHNPPLM